ncbi:unnamed protein product, partial [Rotaria sp. Silwood2]
INLFQKIQQLVQQVNVFNPINNDFSETLTYQTNN